MSVVLSRLSLALEGQDVSFEKGQIAALLGEAGFGRVETRSFSLGMGEGELVVARKNKGEATLFRHDRSAAGSQWAV